LVTKHTSISELSQMYADQVRRAVEDEELFDMFRRLLSIRTTIEPVTAAQGAEYRAIVLEQTPALLERLDKFKTSDTAGRPVTEPYPEGQMSPTTWRYIKVLSDLQLLFGSLDGLHIVEIGVGYGGQCKIINDVYDVARYTLYDLEPVEALAEKYLRRLGSPVVEKLELADFRRLGEGEPATYDLAISNWAFSECTREMQDQYIEHVLRRSTRGYITYNQISHFYGIDSYRKGEIAGALGLPVQVMHEGLNLKVEEDIENFVLHWNSAPAPE
jgi:putative sugar O-methyltransferase